MATISESVEVALAHHRAGRLQQADQIYRRLLDKEPRNAGAWHWFGVLALQLGRHEIAVDRISNAIRLDGFQAAFHGNLGEAYRGMGRWNDARLCYEQALRIQPELSEARFRLATLLAAQGQPQEAIAHYRSVVAARPLDAAAHFHFGAALIEVGAWSAAVESCRRAVEMDPSRAQAHTKLGLALSGQGQWDPACAAFERALALDPEDADAHFGLGMALQRQEHWERAAAAYERALHIRPAFVAALNSLGVVCQAQGNLTAAIAHYQRALHFDPQCADAHYNWASALGVLNQPHEAVAEYRRALECDPTLADAYYNIGTTLEKLGHLDEAATAFEQAVQLRDDFALAHNNLGNVYRAQGKLPAAVASYRRALSADAKIGVIHNNLGSVLLRDGQLSEGLACFQRALGLEPGLAEAYNNLGVVSHQQGHLDEALDYYAQSLRLRDDFPEAHYNRALVYLSQENFAEGWTEFEWRLKNKDCRPRAFSQPMWDGAAWGDRTLLVYAEQGLGDTLQFIRYLGEVSKRGGKLLLEVPRALVGLLKCSGYGDAIAVGTNLPPFDLQASLLSMPKIFGTTLENLPAKVPYLAADVGLIEFWQERLASFAGFRVGINWQGNPSYAFDSSRSVPLREFGPLAAIDGVQLFSLQKGHGTEQLPEWAGPRPIHDFGDQLDRHSGPFMDTAAIMKNLDLVITSDTATAHLAGALGVPVWVPLSVWPEWRWFLNRQTSPWYPTMRLFRQQTPGDWSEPFAQMAEQLAPLVATVGH